ncbi:MAG TPA: Spy/CpxP family protein refolding chaperone [Polyangia bacterium]|nr:Spy/CpxP family protein refolding chaperone [Polyangia bacterium]
MKTQPSPVSPKVRIVTTLLASAAVAGACSHAANGPPPATAATAEDAEGAGLLEHHSYHHHGGTTLFISMSLETLGVSPEQRAVVQKIRDDLDANMEAARAAEDELVTTLAEGVSASRFDDAKIDAAVVKMTAAATQVDEASKDALNELHGALTPAQRDALVDKVEAHWAVWRKANVEEASAATPARRDHDHLAALESELLLTPEQVSRVRASLADDMKAVPPLDHERVSVHLRTFGAAFRAASFDARSLTAAASAADEQIVRWGAVHLVHVVEAMSAVVTPNQRAELAERLHVHATHGAAERGAS